MATEFTLTNGVVRSSTQGEKQALYLALDVSQFDEITARLWVQSLTGTTPSVTIRLLTGMEKDTTDGYVVLHSFPAINTSNVAASWNGKGLLRYIIWEVSALTGSGSPEAAFQLDGMLRTN